MRRLIQGYLKDSLGNIIQGASYYVYKTGTTNEANIYTTLTSSTPATQPLTTDASGKFSFYVSDFDYGSTQLFDIYFPSPVNTIFSSVKGEAILTTYNITSNTTVSYPIKVPYGVIFNISYGVTLTINGAFEAGLYQVFSGDGDIVFGSGSVDYLRPEWFKTNTIPGTTDMRDAFQKCINIMASCSIQTLKLSSSIYYFTDYVEISTLSQDIRITGEAIAGFSFGATTRLSEIRGANGLSTFFLISANNFALEVDHIRFYGTHKDTGVKSAFKITAIGSPARPVNIHNCHFLRFDKAIHVVPSGSGDTSICQVNIENNTFFGNDYSLYGEGVLGAIMDLRFVGNVSENGGKIYTKDRAAGGTWYIADNLLEGDFDSITISAGLCNCAIERNYFEVNTGTIISFSASNPWSSLVLRNNYYWNCTGYISVSTCHFDGEQDIQNSGLTLRANNLFRDSKIGVFSNNYPITSQGDCSQNQLCISTVNGRLNTGIADITLGMMVSAGDSLVDTPLGLRGYTIINGLGSLVYIPMSLNIYDIVVVTVLAKTQYTDSSLYVAFYDHAYSCIWNTETSFSPFWKPDTWVLCTFACSVRAPASGNFYIRFASNNSGDIYISDWFVYKSAYPAPVIPYLPSTERSGVTTITNPSTTVTVTHNAGITPRNIQAIPTENLGNIWVTNVTSTTFVINVSSAPATSANIYWRVC